MKSERYCVEPVCVWVFLCLEISLTCELAASEAQTRHSGCEDNGGEDSGDSGREDESRESEAVVRPPPYTEVEEEFSTLEAKARSSGMEDVSFHLEKARTAWIRAHASSKKGQQQNIRSFCLLYTSPSPRDQRGTRMPSSA